MGKPALQLEGQRFHHMTVIRRVDTGSKAKSYWLARCDCGKEIVAPGTQLKSGVYQSCGCMKNQLIAKGNRTHGMSHHPLYAVWDTMIARCHRPSHKSYGNYGGRGISVCTQWRSSSQQFFSDMQAGYKPGLQLDRIDGTLGYSPENCRWATAKQQANNTRVNRKVVCPDGVTRNISEAADLYGIGRTTLLNRLHQGWPAEYLFIPVSHANRIQEAV